MRTAPVLLLRFDAMIKAATIVLLQVSALLKQDEFPTLGANPPDGLPNGGPYNGGHGYGYPPQGPPQGPPLGPPQQGPPTERSPWDAPPSAPYGKQGAASSHLICLSDHVCCCLLQCWSF